MVSVRMRRSAAPLDRQLLLLQR
ncbi:expressed unknown protein [Ectocarpus siliculosus]|uniref:Uncharacterized protein n=1 Tax=Ectocarpus siliculosus TaxID=2880 RepID=D7FKQ6_ECTSI|nr:expressed unknown protein [Ectocarpus siliculosus]|eukprot:CBJ29455.1 expressed unknown protein [Ectocarpus siliculosus]